MEQVRITKEMRERDRKSGRPDQLCRPRIMVWENVCGAFSSNEGRDFQAVLTEIARIAEPGCPDVPLPDKGKWPKSGCIYDEMGRWSIAYRQHDAQYWGVPQRRKRIALVADFNGLAAPEIIFDPQLRGDAEGDVQEQAVGHTRTDGRREVHAFSEGMPGDSEQGETPREKTAGSVGGGADSSEPIPINTMVGTRDTEEKRTTFGIGEPGDPQFTLSAAHEHAVAISFQERAGKPGGGKGILIQEEHVGALSTVDNQRVLAFGISAYDSNAMKSPNPNSGIYEAETARTLDLNGGSPACNQGGMAIVCIEGNGTRDSHQGDGWKESETMYTLNTVEQHAVLCAGFKAGQSADAGLGYEEEKAPTLSATPSALEPTVLVVNDHGSVSTGKTKLISHAFNAGAGSTRDIQYLEECCPTIRQTAYKYPPAVLSESGEPATVAFTQNQRDEIRDLNDVAGSLSAEPGMRQQTFVCQNQSVYSKGTRPHSANEAQKWELSEVANTLNTHDSGETRTNELIVQNERIVYENHGQDSRFTESGECAQTVSATYGMGGNNQPLVVEMTSTKNTVTKDGISPTLTARMGTGGNQVNAICIGNGQADMASNVLEEVSHTLNCMHDPMAIMTVCGEEVTPTLTASINKGPGNTQDGTCVIAPNVAHTLKNKSNCQYREDSETYVCAAVDCRNGTENEDVNGTLQAKEQGQNLNSNNVCRIDSVVRRLTPLECERLQGFPDGWADIGDWCDSKNKKHKAADGPRYKALGNSLALPFWRWLARRICAIYERQITMGSLFDGISGFPLVFSECGAKPLWSSDIEEFAIAVAKEHFPDEEETQTE